MLPRRVPASAMREIHQPELWKSSLTFHIHFISDKPTGER
jgi:hypothetical protein